MIVDICSRKGKILVKSAKCDKLADLNYALISKFPKYTVERQRLTLETGAVLAADLAGLKNGGTIF